MAESVEHMFLSQTVTAALGELSRTNLYAYVEAERRKFDFACDLVRDWSRPLVGQTLWNHVAGVDKDLRTMLLDKDAEICAYVARDTLQARRLISEVMHDFRSSGATVLPHRLRVLWVPADFDADHQDQRETITQIIWDSVSRDILMNVVFGNLTAEDVRFFVRTSGTPGLHLALLYEISISPDRMLQTKELAERFGVSQGAVRERLIRLLGCGFLTQFGGGASWVEATTLKGRVFLDLCRELSRQVATGHLSDEMLHIMRLLSMRYAPSAVVSAAKSLHLAGPFLTEVPEMATGRLLATITAAAERWGIDLNSMEHAVNKLAYPSLREDDPHVQRLRDESAREHRD